MAMTLDPTPALERYIAACKRAGLPRDMVEFFISSGYWCIEGLLPFHAAALQADQPDGPVELALGGKRGPGKSHAILMQVAYDCQRTPGLKVLFLRKVMKSAAESLEDQATRVLRFVPHSQTANRIEFPNGSRILLGGYNTERDIEKYQGIEYDCIVVEEVTQITKDRREKLSGSRRTSNQDWRARSYYATNADGLGLPDFKKDFVIPARNGEQGRRWFMDVSHIHNPFVDPEYQHYLDSLTGALRKAWRDGDWDAFEGMAFPQWDYDRHTCEPFQPPEHWPRWRAGDWGSYAPLSHYWFARDPDIGRVYVYRELYEAGLTDRAAARKIAEMTPPDEQISVTYGDPNSYFKKSNKDFTVFTPADEYAKEGIIISKADNDRINGKRKVDDALADLPDGRPGLVIFRNCKDLIRTLPDLPRDPLHPEDVDTKAEDHAYDGLRYGLTNVGRHKKKKKDPKPNPYAGVKGL
jgi:phage terminase large subunit